MLSPGWSRMSTMRRSLAIVVAVVVLAPMLGSLPVAPAAAVARAVVGSACDASGDGVAGGVVQEVVSSGADQTARDLAERAGLVLTPARAAHQWRVPVCVEVVDDGDPVTDDRRLLAVGPAVQELKPEAAGWERAALGTALEALRPQYVRPGARTSPHVDGVQVVGLETWLAVDPDPRWWVPVSRSARVGEVEVSAVATPRRVRWEFSDGVVKVCEGPGVQWTPAAAGPAPCGRDFARTTAGQPPMVLEVRLEYDVVWSSTIGGVGTMVERSEPKRHELVVGEVQAYLTDGLREAPPGVGPLPLPESSRPADEADCSLSRFWECGDEIVDAVVDAAEVALDALVGPIKAAMEQVWSFLKGCAAFVGEVFGSVKQVLTQMGELVANPQKFVEEKLQLVQKMVAAAKQDAGAFATEVLGGMVDRDLFEKDKAMWAGKIGCELAIGILTGGASAAGGRLAKQLADLPGLMRKIDDWLTRRNNGTDGDGTDPDGGTAPGTCAASSFPTGTEVLMADGTPRAIEQLEPGDMVLAFDAGDGSWAPRMVLHQWSYLDTDEMATLRLADGSSVAATDHHRFWSSSSRTFREAEQLDPGEQLATPTGTVGLTEVTVRPSGPTLVWELTVAVDHTFAVLAGPHPLAVHNRCDPPPSADAIDDALADAPDLEGITRADVEDAWSRYTGTEDPATWLPQYIRARRMSYDGNAYETQVRTANGLTKNNEAFPPGGTPQFIPDAVPSKAPLHFVEVKRYETTKLEPAGNAGDQIRYLQDWARQNPGQSPRFDLYISNQNMISPSFQVLIANARRDGVIITVTEIRPA